MPPAIAGEIMKEFMKEILKNGLIISIFIAAFVIAAVVATYQISYPQDKYFENFDGAQVQNIVVYPWFASEMTEAVISESDKEKMIELLERVRLIGKSERDGFYLQGGFFGMFRIELTNGNRFEFAANCPYYVIDWKRWYKTEDTENCHAIYDLYYELVEKYFGTYDKK